MDSSCDMRKLLLDMKNFFFFFHHKSGRASEQVPREVLESLGDSKNSTGLGPEQPDLVEPALRGKLDQMTSRHPFQTRV